MPPVIPPMMPKIWLNGALVAPDTARIAPNDRGFLLGDGVFDTLCAAPGGLVDFERHMARLSESAATIGIENPYTDNELKAACRTVLDASGLLRTEASLRITLTRGPGPRGLLPPADPSPTCLVAAAPAVPPPAALSVVTAAIRRNDASPVSRIKALAYLDNVLAKRDAVAAGADDALMLNTSGHVACLTAANVFIVEGNALTTPPVSDGVLPGIVRGRVLEIAERCNYRAVEESIAPVRFAAADLAFATNSLIGLVPIVRIDHAPLRGDAADVRSLSAAYLDSIELT